MSLLISEHPTLIACKVYAGEIIPQALMKHDVVAYQSAINIKINDLCLQIGLFQAESEDLRVTLTKRLVDTINEITKDQDAQKKITEYTKSIILIGQDYKRLISES